MAYIAYSSEDNRVMHIGPLTRDFTGVQVQCDGSLTCVLLSCCMGGIDTVMSTSSCTKTCRIQHLPCPV